MQQVLKMGSPTLLRCLARLHAPTHQHRRHMQRSAARAGAYQRTAAPHRSLRLFASSAAAPAVQKEDMSKVEHKAEQPQPKYRKDYKPTPYFIERLHLDFQLNEESTKVVATSQVKPNHSGDCPVMELDGRSDMALDSVAINGTAVDASKYELSLTKLTLKECPKGDFELTITTTIKPQENTLLEGLYKSGGNYCSQCEAEGFRGITYFYDRPDVLSKYTCRVEADKTLYPVLLSNGNLKESGDAEGGRHFTVWEDPWPKPCYLFALVAGDLKMAEDTFGTKSGKTATLRIFVQESNIDKVAFAMQSLKQAMKWDEERFGLEYDLDLFNIVAVDDFNMGAMENKSLNVFNSRLVLATPETATDGDFERIQGVVGHEYFHNWTGNRVTCRDWFQLTLKEGLTVYRDSEFTSDLNSRAVKRIADVTMMRTAQFAQDAGPMAHPIRPDSYIKMDNFYTVTVYEKGCEVVRMYETVLGRDGFRKGIDLYFERHDGSAVTCDDFLKAMADANGEDLTALGKWYGQAGTPTVTVSTSYDKASQTLALTVKQRTPATKDQPEKAPVMIPVRMGLLGPSGAELPFTVTKGRHKRASDTEAVLIAEDETSTFELSGVAEQPVPSVLRDFSAPVTLTVEGQTEDDLVFILANDTDEINRWDAAQRLAKNLLLSLYDAAKGATGDVDDALVAAGGVKPALIEAYRSVLANADIDGSSAAATLTLPTQSELVQTIDEADPVLVHKVRKFVARSLAEPLTAELLKVLKANDVSTNGAGFTWNKEAVARRAYKNKALQMLCATGDEAYRADALRRFRAADNMTDSVAAVAAVLDADCDERAEMLREFYERWKGDSLVTLKWLTMQAGSNREGNLAEVRALAEHPAFEIKNPNCCYSLILAFARSAVNFHAADGSGYEWLADMVLAVDKVNYQVSARIVSAFTAVKQVDAQRQALIQKQLRRILDTEGLSPNVSEIVAKTVE